MGYPHLINMDSFNENTDNRQLSIPDMIVTLLYHYDEEVLSIFLNPYHRRIKFCRREPRNGDDEFVIERNDNMISVHRVMSPSTRASLTFEI